MKPAKSPQCLCCNKDFDSDPRNARHQKYCSEPPCRKASKAASQRLWLAKPENVNYHSGPEAVARVTAWQKAHPGCRARQKAKRAAALQVFCAAQALESTHELPACKKISVLPLFALQDFITTQPFVFIGLLAHLFHFTLQDDIAQTARSLQQLGEDITNGKGQDEFFKTGNFSRACAARAAAVQLGGSAIGAG